MNKIQRQLVSLYIKLQGFVSLTSALAGKLSEYDLAICRAFSYKVQMHTTDKDFHKLPCAFPTNPPLPRLDKIRSCMTFLSGFRPDLYNCCPNSCCCYVGPYVNLSTCPYCKQPRYHPDGKSRKKYAHIPIIPHLVSLVGNLRTAEQMRYRALTHTHTHQARSTMFSMALIIARCWTNMFASTAGPIVTLLLKTIVTLLLDCQPTASRCSEDVKHRLGHLYSSTTTFHLISASTSRIS